MVSYMIHGPRLAAKRRDSKSFGCICCTGCSVACCAAAWATVNSPRNCGPRGAPFGPGGCGGPSSNRYTTVSGLMPAGVGLRQVDVELRPFSDRRRPARHSATRGRGGGWRSRAGDPYPRCWRSTRRSRASWPVVSPPLKRARTAVSLVPSLQAIDIGGGIGQLLFERVGLASQHAVDAQRLGGEDEKAERGEQDRFDQHDVAPVPGLGAQRRRSRTTPGPR